MTSADTGRSGTFKTLMTFQNYWFVFLDVQYGLNPLPHMSVLAGPDPLPISGLSQTSFLWSNRQIRIEELHIIFNHKKGSKASYSTFNNKRRAR